MSSCLVGSFSDDHNLPFFFILLVWREELLFLLLYLLFYLLFLHVLYSRTLSVSRKAEQCCILNMNHITVGKIVISHIDSILFPS